MNIIKYLNINLCKSRRIHYGNRSVAQKFFCWTQAQQMQSRTSKIYVSLLMALIPVSRFVFENEVLGYNGGIFRA